MHKYKALCCISIAVLLATPAQAQNGAAPGATGGALSDRHARLATPVSEAPVIRAARHLPAGAIIQLSDLTFDSEPTQAAKAQAHRIAGQEVKKTIYAGKQITGSFIGPPTLVNRNALVTIEFEKGPLLITTEGRALDAGAKGQSVRVMNLDSKITLSAVVVSASKVRTR